MAAIAVLWAMPGLAADQVDEWRDFATQMQHNCATASMASDALVQSYREAAGRLRQQLEAVTKERDQMKAGKPDDGARPQ